MQLCVGQIVRSLAGRDKGKYMVVMAIRDKTVLICDGKERPLEKPKVKNIRHIEPTSYVTDSEQLITNVSIRHMISDFTNCRRS